MAQEDEGCFEAKMKRLEEIVRQLESPELSLEQGLQLYREGLRCSAWCRERLNNARHEIEIWRGEDAAAWNPPTVQDGTEGPDL